jgi:hypothetical protein
MQQQEEQLEAGLDLRVPQQIDVSAFSSIDLNLFSLYTY